MKYKLTFELLNSKVPIIFRDRTLEECHKIFENMMNAKSFEVKYAKLEEEKKYEV